MLSLSDLKSARGYHKVDRQAYELTLRPSCPQCPAVLSQPLTVTERTGHRRGGPAHTAFGEGRAAEMTSKGQPRDIWGRHSRKIAHQAQGPKDV